MQSARTSVLCLDAWLPRYCLTEGAHSDSGHAFAALKAFAFHCRSRCALGNHRHVSSLTAESVLCRTKHTFSLLYPKGKPSMLLRLLASTVEAHGGTAEEDPENFTLSATFQEQSAPGNSAISAGLPRGVPHAGASNVVKAKGSSLRGPQEPSASVSSVLKEDADERAVKRQRTHGAHCEDSGRGQVSFTMMMTLRQESAGAFVVLAALQQARVGAPAAAAAFTAKCHAIQRDIGHCLMN